MLSRDNSMILPGDQGVPPSVSLGDLRSWRSPRAGKPPRDGVLSNMLFNESAQRSVGRTSGGKKKRAGLGRLQTNECNYARAAIVLVEVELGHLSEV